MSPRARDQSEGEEQVAGDMSDVSGDDGCVAGEAAAVGPADRRRVPRQGGTGKKTGGASASAASAPEDEGATADAPRPTCAACDQAIETPAEVVMRGTSNTAMHRDCLNVTTYLERHIRQVVGPDALRKFKTEKPAEFRYRVLDLLVGKEACGMRKRRGPAEEARALELAEEVSFYSTCFKQQYVLLLSERAFKQWFSGVAILGLTPRCLRELFILFVACWRKAWTPNICWRRCRQSCSFNVRRIYPRYVVAHQYVTRGVSTCSVEQWILSRARALGSQGGESLGFWE